MIAKLTGTLDALETHGAVIDVAGVGYRIACSARTLAALGRAGAKVSVLVETVLRDEQILLYGFRDLAERDWFRLLTTVQGVGPRVALAILSVLSPEEALRAIASGDRTIITRADGVGPKLATRIVSELKERVGPTTFAATAAPGGRGSENDAVSALVNLGYGRAEAFGAVAKASKRLGAAADVGALIRDGLRELAQ